MKKKLIGLMVVLCALILPLASMAMNVGGTELVKRGTGARKILGMAVYDATLYVAPALQKASGREVVMADQPMTVVLRITNPMISKDMFTKSVRKGFAKSAAAGYTTDKAEYYLSLYNGIEIKKGSVFQHDYDPQKKLFTLTYTTPEGARRVLGVVPGLQFKAAIYGMWLGSNPTSEDLREGMLGK